MCLYLPGYVLRKEPKVCPQLTLRSNPDNAVKGVRARQADV